MTESQKNILASIKAEFWRRHSGMSYEETLKLWVEWLEEEFMKHSAKKCPTRNPDFNDKFKFSEHGNSF
jgi:hypothetical protein